jgi:hypothetical protein
VPRLFPHPEIPFLHVNDTEVGGKSTTHLASAFSLLAYSFVILVFSLFEDGYCFTCSFYATSLLVLCAALAQPLYQHHVYLPGPLVGDQAAACAKFSADSFVCIHLDS